MRNKKTNGFTLVEVLLSIVIGGIVLGSALSAYSIFSNTAAQIQVSEQLQQEVNFSLIRISDRIRAESIGYTQYSQARSINDSRKLFLGDDTQVIFKNTEKMLFMNKEPLFSSVFEVENAQFRVLPTQDPNGNISDFSQYRQPKVDINLTVRSKQFPNLDISVRTSISSRLYQ